MDNIILSGECSEIVTHFITPFKLPRESLRDSKRTGEYLKVHYWGEEFNKVHGSRRSKYSSILVLKNKRLFEL